MKTKKYVLMRCDECGYYCRAEGDEKDFLVQVFEFPDFDPEDEPMFWAFQVWKEEIRKKAQDIWNSQFGSESRIFLEEYLGR